MNECGCVPIQLHSQKQAGAVVPGSCSEHWQEDSSGSFQLWGSRVPWTETLAFPHVKAPALSLVVWERGGRLCFLGEGLINALGVL